MALGRGEREWMVCASQVKCAEQLTMNICAFFSFLLITSFAMSWHEQCILSSGKLAKINTSGVEKYSLERLVTKL